MHRDETHQKLHGNIMRSEVATHLVATLLIDDGKEVMAARQEHHHNNSRPFKATSCLNLCSNVSR